MESKHATKAADARIFWIAAAMQAKRYEFPLVHFARQPYRWQLRVIAMPPASSVIDVVTGLWVRIPAEVDQAEFVVRISWHPNCTDAGS
jgi:hypothetical protein